MNLPESTPPPEFMLEIENLIQQAVGTLAVLPDEPGAFIVTDGIPLFFASLSALRNGGVSEEIIAEIVAGKPGCVPAVVIYGGWAITSWLDVHDVVLAPGGDA